MNKSLINSFLAYTNTKNTYTKQTCTQKNCIYQYICIWPFAVERYETLKKIKNELI